MVILAGNIYPAAGAISLREEHNPKRRLYVHGGSSLGVSTGPEGCINLMMERSVEADDEKGLNDGASEEGFGREGGPGFRFGVHVDMDKGEWHKVNLELRHPLQLFVQDADAGERAAEIAERGGQRDLRAGFEQLRRSARNLGMHGRRGWYFSPLRNKLLNGLHVMDVEGVEGCQGLRVWVENVRDARPGGKEMENGQERRTLEDVNGAEVSRGSNGDESESGNEEGRDGTWMQDVAEAFGSTVKHLCVDHTGVGLDERLDGSMFESLAARSLNSGDMGLVTIAAGI